MQNIIQQTIKIFLWGKEIGTLSWNPAKNNSYFFFSPLYFNQKYDLTPLTCPKNSPQSKYAILGENDNGGEPEKKIYQSLPPFIADSLPDKWGNAVFEEWFRTNNLKEKDKNPLTKLSFIGKRAIGALEFIPEFSVKENKSTINLQDIYQEALKYQNSLSEVTLQLNDNLSREAFTAMGTSAGGRQMKAIIAILPDGTIRSGQTATEPDARHCIIKFNTPCYQLSEIEKTYYDLAQLCGINMMPSQLLRIEGINHFITERFDRVKGEKVFTQTLAALNPEAHTYEELFSTCDRLRLPYADKEQLFKRTVFNFLMNNTDDHSKNFSFTMNKEGVWSLSPAYDMNFIFAETGKDAEKNHCMPLEGKFHDVTMSDLIRFANKNGIKDPDRIIQTTLFAAKQFPTIAKKNGVGNYTSNIISKRLSELCGITLPPLYKESSFTTQKGDIISNIEFSLNEKQYIVLKFRSNGTELKKHFSPKNPKYDTILKKGLNNMTISEKKKIISDIILSQEQNKKEPNK